VNQDELKEFKEKRENEIKGFLDQIETRESEI
jgi:hypothetical protein